MKRSFLTVTAVLALAAGATPVLAQETPPPRFEERVDVTEVLLDVLVTDRDNNVIIGLKPEDFVVEEDGKAVPVRDVTFYSNRRYLGNAEAAAAQGIKLNEVQEDRYFILFFHDQQTANFEAPGLMARQMEAAREARRWVREERLPNDWVAVVSYDHKLKVQQDFTRKEADLLRAVDGASQGRDPGGNWPSRAADDKGPSLLARLPRGNELRDQTATIYDGIETLAEAAGAVRGRKNMILFTIGFGTINSFGQYIPDPRYYPDMQQALNDNNVAVYAVDLVPTGTDHTMSSAMNQLALDTGGRYYFNFTSFITPLRQLAEDNNGYYLLAYESRHPQGETGYTEVTVKTKNPDFRVRAREGYLFGEEVAAK